MLRSRPSHRVWYAPLIVVVAASLVFPASSAWSHGGGFHGGGGGRGGFGGGMSRGGMPSGGGMSRGGMPSGMNRGGPSGGVSGRGPSGSVAGRGGAGPGSATRGPSGGKGPGRDGGGPGAGKGGPGRGGPGAGAPGRGGRGNFAGDPLAHGNLSADHLRSLGRGSGATNLKAQSIQSLDARGSQIRNNFYRGNWYGGRGWYNDHFHAWWPGRWYGGWGGWGVGLATGLLWADLASWGGYGQPIAYDYGTTVVYSDDAVTVAGEEVGTPEEYAESASDLANSGAEAEPADDAEWRPLGVYALANDGETKPSTFISLAVNTDGILRGNYYDAISDSSLEISGKVDPKTQRAAWTIGDKTSNVYEAGLSNLLKDETQVLVHRDGEDGKPSGKVDQMLLVRVDDGDDKAGES